jgi:hypothetical protein
VSGLSAYAVKDKSSASSHSFSSQTKDAEGRLFCPANKQALLPASTWRTWRTWIIWFSRFSLTAPRRKWPRSDSAKAWQERRKASGLGSFFHNDIGFEIKAIFVNIDIEQGQTSVDAGFNPPHSSTVKLISGHQFPEGHCEG